MKSLLLAVILLVPFVAQAGEKSPDQMSAPELCSSIASQVMASGEIPIKSEHITLYKVECVNGTELTYHGEMKDIPPVEHWKETLTGLINLRACNVYAYYQLLQRGVTIVNDFEFDGKTELQVVSTAQMCEKLQNDNAR